MAPNTGSSYTKLWKY